GQVVRRFTSAPAGVVPPGGYLFTALPGRNEVGVIDTHPTIAQGTNPPVPNPNLNTLIARIPLPSGSYIRYVAATPDNTRVYVTASVHQGIAVIDALALQQVDTDPSTASVDEIQGLPGTANPYEIAIDPQGYHAYVSDHEAPLVYVIDIRPSSKDY